MEAEVFSTGIAADFSSLRKNKNNKKQKPANFVSKEEREQRRAAATERLRNTIDYDGGKFIVFSDEIGNLEYGVLVAGIEIKHRLYIAYLTENRDVKIRSIGDKYKIARDIPAKMSVLDYLVRTERNDMRELVSKIIESNTDWKLVTEIGLKPWKPRPNKPKNDKKKNQDR